jgi:hypothetical protein
MKASPREKKYKWFLNTANYVNGKKVTAQAISLQMTNALRIQVQTQN